MITKYWKLSHEKAVIGKVVCALGHPDLIGEIVGVSESTGYYQDVRVKWRTGNRAGRVLTARRHNLVDFNSLLDYTRTQLNEIEDARTRFLQHKAEQP